MKTIKHRQLQRKLLVAAVAAACSAGQFVYANPVGPAVVGGQATFAARGNQLSVTNTPGAIINWQQFSIQVNETTRFIQQSAASTVLNRVVGVDPSQILGTLQSNGRVFLINPNGVLFGAGAQIDVAGLVASTLNLSNQDFIAGRMNFAGDPAQAAAIVNQGRISASPGGQVFLVGSAVDNQGVITAPGGDIVLAAGKSVRVTDSTSAGLQVEITAPADHALNLSEVTHSSRGIYTGLVRNSGIIQADSVVRGADGSITLKASNGVQLDAGSVASANGTSGGRIIVDAQQGDAVVSGTLSARGSDGVGGSVAVTGNRVGLFDTALVDASGASGGGNILLGGDTHGSLIRDGGLDLPNSQRAYVGPDAQIRADALMSGDGGKVIVWADDTTQFYGAISARGGSSSGNGGFVETSGKGWLDFQGLVDTRASAGAAGTLLLDPTNITISVAASTPTMAFGAGTYTDTTTTPSNLNVTTLTTQLGLSNVTVSTASALAGNGDITVNDLISYNSGFNLNLAATRNITVAAGTGITNAGAGALTLTGGGAGSIAINENISTNGGTITLNSGAGGVTLANAKSIDAGSGRIAINAGAGPVNFGTGTLQTSNATAAAIVVANATTIALGNAALTGGGTLNLSHSGAATQTGGTTISGTGNLTKAGAGTLTLSQINTYTGTTTVNAGTLALGASNALDNTSSLVVNGGIFSITGFNQTLAGVQLAAGSITGSGGTLTSTGTFDLQAGAVSAILGGAVGVDKTTGGTVTLSGANTYTGATAVTAGVLNLQNATATGTTAGGVTVANGAALELQGGIAVGNETLSIAGTGVGSNGVLRNISGNNTWGGTVTLTGAATIQSDANTLTLNAANAVTGAAQNLTLAGAGNGAISGTITTTTGALTMSGAGTWTLSGANAYTGTTTVNAGTLALGASNALANTGSLVVNGGTFSMTGFNQTLAGVQLAAGSITGSGGILTSTTAYDLRSGTVSAILAGAGIGLNKTTGGTVTLSGVNTFDGVTTINAGTLSVGTIGNGGVAGNLGQATAAAANLVLGGGTLQYTGATAATNRAFTLTAAATSAIDVTNAASNLTMSGAGAATTGALTKLGAGTLTLSGANAYTGTTTVNAGTLAYGASDVLATGAVTVDGATAVLALGNNQSDSVGTVTVANGGSITGTGTSTLTSTGTFEMQSGSVSAMLAGAGIPLNKTTAGTVTLSGANTYTGLTTVSAGILNLNTTGANSIAGNLTISGGSVVLQKSDQIADTANVVVSGGTLDIGANNETVAGVQLTSGNIIGTIGTLTSLSDFDLRSGTVGAILGGTVGVAKTTAGTVTLSGNNTYTGATTVSAGTLAVTVNNALGTAAQGTTVANGATLDFQNVNYSTTEALTVNGGTLATSTGTSSFAGTVTLGANSTVAVDGTQLTLAGVISEGSGGLGLDKTGAGTLVLSGANTYTGTTTVTAGTLALGASDRLDDASHLVVNGGTFSIGTFSDTVAGVQLAAGSITGTTGTLTSLSDFDLQSGTVSAILGGTVGVTKTTAGGVTLSGSDTYTGATAVNAGTLTVTNNNALGGTGAGTTVASGATLAISNAAIVAEPMTLNGNGVGGVGALTGTGVASLAGNVMLNTASTVGVATGADSLTLGGTVDGPGALSLIGAGTVTFGNAVGGTTALASLTQNVATALNINGGLVRTAGNQTYNGPVATGGATTLRTTANGNIAANGAFTATAGTLTLDTGAGDATFNNVLNNFGTVQVTSGGTVSLVDANAMTLGTSSMGAITARALSGNLTLGGTVTATGAGNSIVLAASGNFINTAGAAALNPGAGRWLVYSTNPAADARGGLVYDFKQYNATFVSPVLGTGNGFLYTVAPSVTPSLNGTATKVYDGTIAATLTPANYSFAGVIDGDTIALGNASSGTYDTQHVGAGKLVTVAGLTLAGASNGAAIVYGYSLASTTANANIGVITPAALTVTANNQSKTYGTTFTFAGTEFTPAGLQNGETIASVTLASVGAPPTAHVAGGPYAITASAATGGTFTPTDYTISYVNGALTVNTAALSVTANDQVKAYGTPFTFAGSEFTSSGLQNGETIASVTLTSAGAPATASVAGSPYPIVASAATGGTFTATDYAISYVNGAFTVNPAGLALTVTANNLSKTYGTALIFTGSEFTSTGLQNGETIGSVTLTSAGAAAGAPVAGSPYPIIPIAATGGTFTPSNYTISYVNGVLMVNPAPLTIRADDKNRFPGTSNPLFTATYTGFQLGETPAVLTGVLGFTTTAIISSPTGNYPIVPSGQTSTNYAITYVNGTLSIQSPSSVTEGLLTDLLAALRRLGIEDFNAEIADCMGSGSGAGSAASLGAAPKGVAAKSNKKCNGAGSSLTVVGTPPRKRAPRKRTPNKRTPRKRTPRKRTTSKRTPRKR